MEKTLFEYQIYCYIPWDAVYLPDTMEFVDRGDIRVKFFREKQKRGAPEGFGRIFATASKGESRRSDRPLTKFLVELAQGRLPVDLIDEPFLSRLRKEEPEAVSTGLLPTVRSIPETLLPGFYADFLHAVRDELAGSVERVLDLLAHRVAGLPEAHGPTLRLVSIRIPPVETWTSLPQGVVTAGSMGGPIPRIDASTVTDVQSQLLSAEAVPMRGYSLFREAWGAMMGHPRAAFITAYVAIETACKEWLGHEVPETTWLVEHMPSPPLNRLVSEYIVGIVRRRGFAQEADELQRLAGRLQQHASVRNKLAHGAGADLPYAEAKAAVRDMERVYWLLQVVSGAPGARESLRQAEGRR